MVRVGWFSKKILESFWAFVKHPLLGLDEQWYQQKILKWMGRFSKKFHNLWNLIFSKIGDDWIFLHICFWILILWPAPFPSVRLILTLCHSAYSFVDSRFFTYGGWWLVVLKGILVFLFESNRLNLAGISDRPKLNKNSMGLGLSANNLVILRWAPPLYVASFVSPCVPLSLHDRKLLFCSLIHFKSDLYGI